MGGSGGVAGACCAFSRWRNRRSIRSGRAGARVPAESEDGDLHGAPAELQGLVAAPHVDVDVAALDRRAGVHDRVDAVVRSPSRSTWMTDPTGSRSGRRRRCRSGRSRPTRSSSPCSSAVAVNRSRAPGARGGRRFAELRLPGRIAGIQRGHLIQQGEGDGGRGRRHDLAPGRSRQIHQFGLALGGRGPLYRGQAAPVKGVPASNWPGVYREMARESASFVGSLSSDACDGRESWRATPGTR